MNSFLPTMLLKDILQVMNPGPARITGETGNRELRIGIGVLPGNGKPKTCQKKHIAFGKFHSNNKRKLLLDLNYMHFM